MLAGLSRRVHGLMADVESYSLQSGTQRVIGYLLRQEAEGDEGQSAYTVRLPTSKSIVASRLNLTPEHFSRILHELVDRGLVAVEGRDVRIVDAQKLRATTPADAGAGQPAPRAEHGDHDDGDEQVDEPADAAAPAAAIRAAGRAARAGRRGRQRVGIGVVGHRGDAALIRHPRSPRRGARS